MNDARRYAVCPEPRSLKGSRPSVPHGTNFLVFILPSSNFILCNFCRSASDSAPDGAAEACNLEQSAEKDRGATLASEAQQPEGDTDGTSAAENTSFSVDELTVKLRKSLTLDEQPQNELLAATVQLSVETDVESNAGKIVTAEQPDDDSATFFDCENKSFDKNVLQQDTVVESTQDITCDVHPAPSEANVPDVQQIGDIDNKADAESPEVATEMAANLDQPKSPPIAATKGSYTVNWDEVDENTNPVMPKQLTANSPSRSPVVPACAGAGDGNSVGEIDAIKPSHKLTNSPSSAIASNSLPEPATDSIVVNPADSKVQSEPTDSISSVSENKTLPVDDDKLPEVKEGKTTTTGVVK